MDINKKFNKWLKEQDAIILARQKEAGVFQEYHFGNKPYYGAIGGAWSNMIRIDKDGNTRRYTEHTTGNTFDWPSEDLDDYTKKYLDKIYVKGHEYEISECSTSIGLLLNIKDLTTGQEINNNDDI